jgi:hypothetical protein
VEYPNVDIDIDIDIDIDCFDSCCAGNDVGSRNDHVVSAHIRSRTIGTAACKHFGKRIVRRFVKRHIAGLDQRLEGQRSLAALPG